MSDEIELPSEEELAKLPRYSQVVYALRSALRAQPFLASWMKPPAEYKRSIVILEENFSSLMNSCIDASDVAIIEVMNASAIAAETAQKHLLDELANKNARAAAISVNAAASATASVAEATKDDDDAKTIDLTKAAATAAGTAKTAYSGYTSTVAAVTTTARMDYARLAEIKSDVIDASEAGPLGNLWHGSPPAWYINAKKQYDKTIADWERELAEIEGVGIETFDLEIRVPDELDKQAAFEFISILGAYIDDLHKAKGGSGIEIEFLEIYEPAGVPVPVSPEAD